MASARGEVTVIDFSRAFETAWQRMTIILFQPFDLAKWGLIGFSAFLAMLAEGGVSFNNPLPYGNQNTTASHTYTTLPQALHAFKQFRTWLDALPNDPWLTVFVCLAIAFVVVSLVLNWVGCRGEFIFLDNIVRNRAALAWPWWHYARAGNIWFLLHFGLFLLSMLFFVTTSGVFLYINWAWIDAERNPNPGEIGALVLSTLVFFILGVIGTVIKFLIRTLVLPLYFKQTMSLGSALLAVMHLVFTRPVSIFVYVLLSFVLAVLSIAISCLVFITAFCATFSIICCVACFPFLGAMLMQMVLCQLILPLLVFKRCFQLGCLEQFGPEYDVFSVDLPPPGTPGI